MKKGKFKSPIFFVLIIIAFVLLINLLFGNLFTGATLDKSKEYCDFIEALKDGKVTEVRLNSSTIKYKLYGDDRMTYQVSRISGDNTLIEDLKSGTVKIDKPGIIPGSSTSETVKIRYGTLNESNIGDILYIIFTVVLPLALMGLLFFSVFRSMRKGDGGIGGFGFGKTNAKLFTVSDGSKKFSDVAGQDEAKEQMMELVDFLHQPEKYKSIGAKLPKGALLVGPPGTGKTLLAQAVAGEANVPFFFVSGSAFVEMFVGAGAARVRDLFKQANEKAPCIVFIDEIDAIGKKRDTTGFAGNDEREQSLNQLLAEMDGFDPGKGIIVLGATNRPEILDQALLRPGRFDRRIAVELPDLKGREAILRVHAKPITMASDVDLAEVAKATVGASGADLANIINESALRAVREHHSTVTQEDILASVETVIAGTERKSMVIPEAEKKLVAYHEIGHALAAALQKNTAPVTKITIIPRTSGALGYTMQVDEEEHLLMTKQEILSKLVILTAGRAAEMIGCDDCTTGASNDIERATSLAKSMVTRFGMSDQFGLMTLESQTSIYLGTDGHLTCAPETAAQIDKEVRNLLKKSYDEAVRILTDNRRKLDLLAKELYERENLTGDEFMDILNSADSTEQSDSITQVDETGTESPCSENSDDT